MRFSTKTGYGLRAMIKLAENYSDKPYSLHKLAKEENISLVYLERLVAKLKKQGLVKSAKGAKGGYRLTKQPQYIKIFEIFEILEGSLVPYFCAKTKPQFCKNKKCASQKVWLKLYQSMCKTLKSITLADLIS